MLAACRGTHGRLLPDTECVVLAAISADFGAAFSLLFSGSVEENHTCLR